MDKQNHIIIISDAGPTIGTGHVMRCIALGAALIKKKCRVSIIGRIDSEYLREKIIETGIAGHYKDSNSDSDDILNDFFELYEKSSKEISWVVLDGYQFSAPLQREIKKANVKLLVIDDYAHLPEYAADIILNQNIAPGDLNYNVRPETRFLLGPAYVLLRDEFLNRDFPYRTILDRVGSLLVTMGGADPNNITLKVLELLERNLFFNTRVCCIIGPNNLNRNSIEKWAETSQLRIEILYSVKDMPSLMADVDFAISAAGSTCWELAYMGVPFVTLVIAENQIHISNRLNSSGIAPSAGWADLCGLEKLDHLLQTFAISLVDKKTASIEGRMTVDGLGAGRVADFLLNY